MPREMGRAAIFVLVGEDEPLIRMSAVDLVEEAGFIAIEAENADEAIAILEQRSDISIVFTDIDMPGTMDGLRLAEAVRARWSPVHIIVSSGHRSVSDSDLPAGSRFFPKPYDCRKIAAAMHAFGA